MSIVKDNVWWKMIDEDCSEFIASCFHCLIGETGHTVPDSNSATIHCMKPNCVIHFDYLYMGQGIGNLKYNLVIRDGLSSYHWIISITKADAENRCKRDCEIDPCFYYNDSMGQGPVDVRP